jgi:Hypervirulence associated proteins TUDOR domain
MSETPKNGDAVSWNSHGGKAHGKVVKKLTAPTQIKGHKVAASKDNPQFLVETKEGKQAAHKAEALKKE